MSVIIDQLRISDDGGAMYIDAHVSTTEYFINVNMDYITICTESQVSENHPDTPGDNYVYKLYIGAAAETSKQISLRLTPDDFKTAYLVGNGASIPGASDATATENFSASDFSHNMFFVYFTVTGTPASNTPCNLDKETTVGVTFDYKIIYINQNALSQRILRNSSLCITLNHYALCIVHYAFHKELRQ